MNKEERWAVKGDNKVMADWVQAGDGWYHWYTFERQDWAKSQSEQISSIRKRFPSLHYFPESELPSFVVNSLP